MNEIEKRTNPVPWPGRIALAIATIVLALSNDALGGWGLPVLLGVAVIAIPTLKYRRYWGATWFWLTMLALSVIQLPLIVAARPLMDRYKFGFYILFGNLDLLFIALVVNWVRPKLDEGT